MNLHLNVSSTNGIWHLFPESSIALLTDQRKKIGIIGIAVLGIISLYMIGFLVRRCYFKAHLIQPESCERVDSSFNPKIINSILKPNKKERYSGSERESLKHDIEMEELTPRPANVVEQCLRFEEVSDDTSFESSKKELPLSGVARPIVTMKDQEEVILLVSEEASEKDHLQSQLVTPIIKLKLQPTTPKVVKFLETIEEISEEKRGSYLTPLREMSLTPGYEGKLFHQMDEAYQSANLNESVFNDSYYNIIPFLSPKAPEIYSSYKKRKMEFEEEDFDISQCHFLDTSTAITPNKNQILNRIDEWIASEESESLRMILLELREVERQSLEELDVLLNPKDTKSDDAHLNIGYSPILGRTDAQN